MNSLNYSLIKSIHTTEKSVIGSESQRKYTFKVDPKATKVEIKKIIENFFNVKVEKVWTLNVLGKRVKFKQRDGQRNSYKKAIVLLAEGHEIDLLALKNK